MNRFLLSVTFLSIAYLLFMYLHPKQYARFVEMEHNFLRRIGIWNETLCEMAKEWEKSVGHRVMVIFFTIGFGIFTYCMA